MMNFNVIQVITLISGIAAGIFVGSAEAWNELGELLKVAVPAVISVVTHVLGKDLFKKKVDENIQLQAQYNALSTLEENKALKAQLRA